MSRYGAIVAVTVLSFSLIAASAVQENPASKAESTPAPQEIPASGIEVARQVKQCKKCHIDVFEEWSASRHAQSWKNPVFQAAIKKLDDGGESCARCHAPDSVPLAGFGEVPAARPADREFGVNCTTCHMDGKKYHGPYASRGHGGIITNPDYFESTICESCHGHPEVNAAHDAYTSYLESPAAKEGKTCQDCHMPSVVRKMAKGKRRLRRVQPERPCRVHGFQGAHTTGKGEGAATMTARIEQGRLVVTIDPKTGHALPASEGREVRLLVTFEDADEKKVKTSRRVWDYAKKKVLVPGAENVVRFDVPAGATRARCALELVLQRVPGRATEKRIPIVALDVPPVAADGVK